MAAEVASGSKTRSSSSSAAGGSGEQLPPSEDLLTRAVLLYPEAVVRLQVSRLNWAQGLDVEMQGRGAWDGCRQFRRYYLGFRVKP